MMRQPMQVGRGGKADKKPAPDVEHIQAVSTTSKAFQERSGAADALVVVGCAMR